MVLCRSFPYSSPREDAEKKLQGEKMIRLKIFHTAVKASYAFLPIIIVVWAVVTWLGLYWHPERGLGQSLLIGFVSTILLLVAELGHPLAHTFSARFAGAPMDEIRIAADMPRTLYKNNDVAPVTHRMRALGGPIFNVIGLLLSIAIFEIVSVNSIVREWMTWSAVGHGLLLIMSLTPFPAVDGGTILKWTLIANGRTEIEADKLVRRVDWFFASTILVMGIGLTLMKIWIIGLIFLGIGMVLLLITARTDSLQRH
jgi:hypothetical protein